MNGRRSHEIGQEHEQLVSTCFEAPWVSMPEWLHVFRRATLEEDAQGMDIVAETDIGVIGIQIKSSTRYIAQHLKKYPDVPVLVVHLGESEVQVRKRVLKLLKKIRKQKRDSGVDLAAMSDENLCLACGQNPAVSTGPVPLCASCEALSKRNQRGVTFQSAKPMDPEPEPTPEPPQ